MIRLSSPFITPQEFDTACQIVAQASELYGGADFAVWHNHLDKPSSLVIRRVLSGLANPQDSSGEEEMIESLDEEYDQEQVLIHERQSSCNFRVEYHICLSPTYGVPVVYFQVIGVVSSLESLKMVYGSLVPPSVQSQLEMIGVMGGISLTNDPLTDAPCFFVHPCQTAEALRAVLPNGPLPGATYLQLWLGLVGPSVGLHLPKELAIILNEKS